MSWVAAGDRYELALSGTRVVARRAGGALLKTLPVALKEHPVTEQLLQVRDWLQRHELECTNTVENWMVRSLPIAAEVIEAVWPDPAWSNALRYAVVWAVDEQGTADQISAGFLAGANPERGIGIITLDGETTWLQRGVQAVGIPHPVLLPELEDFRDFATELALEQQLLQLHREIWKDPPDPEQARVDDFSGGRLGQLLQVRSRARAMGYSISGANVVSRIWDAGRFVEARFWVGSDAPQAQSGSGALQWFGLGADEAIPVGELGPIAYSEGMRMAARLYAGRIQGETPE